MPITDNLIAAWQLTESSGSRADSVGGNTLTDNNTVGSGTGLLGTAADFEADDSEYLSRADNTDLSTGNVSYAFSVWVKLESKGANRVIVAKHDGASAAGSEYLLFYDSGADRFGFVVYSGSSALDVYATVYGSPPTGVWIHLAVIHDATNDLIGICVNGGFLETESTAGAAPNDTAAAFYVGGIGTTWPFDGLIEQALFRKGSIWTIGEIAALYGDGSGLAYADLGTAPTPYYKVACDGDSITEGAGGANGYPVYLPFYLPVNYVVAEVGIGGQTLEDMETTRTDVDALYDASAALNVNVMFAGTNDFYLDDASAATVQTRTSTYGTTSRGAFERVVDVTMLPRGDFPGTSTIPGDAAAQEAEFESRRAAVNTWKRANYSSYAHVLCDVAADTRMGDDGDEDDATYYQGDKVHPNNTGADVLAQLVAPAVIAAVALVAAAYVVGGGVGGASSVIGG